MEVLTFCGVTSLFEFGRSEKLVFERLWCGILFAHGASLDHEEDFNGDEKMENDTETNEEQQLQLLKQRSRDESTREFNVNISKQLQAIVGPLASSKLQYYVPSGLWRHFKLQGKPVNL